MRWFWIDRFTAFESGRRAVAVKNVSVAEEHLDEYFPGYPVMTPSLVLEGFAQCGGLLVGQYGGFLRRIVLAKVMRAKFHFYPRPGDLLTYTIEAETLQETGGLIKATSHVNDQLQAEAGLTFAHVEDHIVNVDLFEPAEFLRMLRIFRLFDVGVDAQGNRLPIPPHLLEAEQTQLNKH